MVFSTHTNHRTNGVHVSNRQRPRPTGYYTDFMVDNRRPVPEQDIDNATTETDWDFEWNHNEEDAVRVGLSMIEVTKIEEETEKLGSSRISSRRAAALQKCDTRHEMFGGRFLLFGIIKNEFGEFYGPLPAALHANKKSAGWKATTKARHQHGRHPRHRPTIISLLYFLLYTKR